MRGSNGGRSLTFNASDGGLGFCSTGLANGAARIASNKGLDASIQIRTSHQPLPLIGVYLRANLSCGIRLHFPGINMGELNNSPYFFPDPVSETVRDTGTSQKFLI